MIRVEVHVASNGLASRVSAEGHGLRAPFGGDVVCAAASAILRSAARTFECASAARVSGEAREAGRLEFAVELVGDDSAEWARGVSDSLIRGLADLASEHPEAVAVRITSAKE